MDFYLLYLPLVTGSLLYSLFRFLKDSDQVGPDSPSLGRDFILSSSYSPLPQYGEMPFPIQLAV